MKKSIIACMAILPLLASAKTAGVCERQYGITHCGPGTVDKVRGAGVVTIDGTTVTKTVKLSGEATINKANIHELSVSGHAKVMESTLGATRISGYLESYQNRFTAPLTIAAQEALLEGTQAQEIKVACRRGSSPILRLQKDSHVLGNITFGHCKGMVVADASSSVGGKVINGKQTETQSL